MRNLRVVALVAALLGIAWLLLQLDGGGPPLPPAQVSEEQGADGMVGTLPDEKETASMADASTRSEIVANPSMADERPRLTIRVTRLDTGEVVPRLGLSFFPRDTGLPQIETVYTDHDGLVTVQPIDPGELIVSPGSAFIEVAATGTTHHELVLEPQFEVQGIVLDPSGTPMAGASLFVSRGNSSGHDVALVATTGLDGRFGWTGWSGMELAHARTPGFSPSPGYDLYYDLDDPPFLRIVLRPSEGLLSGTVVDELARPVAGASVYFRPPTPPPVDPELEQEFFKSVPRLSERQVSRTDQDGRFRFSDLHSGPASLRVRARGFSQRIMTVEVDREAETNVTVSLDPPLSVFGLITNSEGRPLKSALVSVGMLYGVDYVGTRSDANGSYVLEGLAPGAVTVAASYPRHEMAYEAVSGEAGQKLRLNLVLQEQRFLRGRLLDEADAPLEGWYVQERPSARLHDLDSEGRFELPWDEIEPPDLVARPPLEGQRLAPPRPLVRDPEPRGERWVYRPAPGTEVTARIKGKLLFPEGAAPALVHLTLVDQGLRSRRTERIPAEEASFEIGPISPGTYSLEIGGDVPRQDLGTHVLARDQLLDLGTMSIHAKVPVRIELSRSDGRPLTWLRSRIFDDQGGVWNASFSGGLFQVEPLLPGKYELMVYSSELQCRNLAFELIPGEPKRLDVELDPGHRVQFRVRLPEGSERPEYVYLTVRNDLGEQVAKIRPYGGVLLNAGESCAFGPGSYEVEAVAGQLRGRAEFTVRSREEGTTTVMVEMR